MFCVIFELLVLAITSGSCKGSNNGTRFDFSLLSRLSDDCVLTDSACVDWFCETSFELGVDSESFELVERVDSDVAILCTSRTTLEPEIIKIKI